MANLAESPQWEAGVYQIETSDPVLGGPEGISNRQAKQLANRTLYLKQQVESAQDDLTAHEAAPDPHPQYLTSAEGDSKIAAAIAALINGSPAALDTLSELAAALGNDANFAATMTNALALKAPLASPAFTGNPTAPTPAQFDNDTSLATTEFVQRALGNMRGFRDISTNTTLTAADAGKLISSNAGTGSVTCLLPPLSTVPPGAALVISHSSSEMTTFSVAASGSDLLVFDGLSLQASPYAMAYGETIIVVSTGPIWKVVAGNGAKMLALGGGFGSSLAASGYQKLPSGLIVQWGSTMASAADFFVTFPITFPTVVASLSFGNNEARYGYHNNFLTTAGFKYANRDLVTGGGMYPDNFFWMAVGY